MYARQAPVSGGSKHTSCVSSGRARKAKVKKRRKKKLTFTKKYSSLHVFWPSLATFTYKYLNSYCYCGRGNQQIISIPCAAVVTIAAHTYTRTVPETSPASPWFAHILQEGICGIIAIEKLRWHKVSLTKGPRIVVHGSAVHCGIEESFSRPHVQCTALPCNDSGTYGLTYSTFSQITSVY